MLNHNPTQTRGIKCCTNLNTQPVLLVPGPGWAHTDERQQRGPGAAGNNSCLPSDETASLSLQGGMPSEKMVGENHPVIKMTLLQYHWSQLIMYV